MNQNQLAVHGGAAVFPDGPPSWPIPDEDVVNNVHSAMADGSWGKYEGRWTDRLLDQVSKLSGCEHVLLCSSGTIAVEIALRAVDVPPASEIILAAYDYPGNFRAIEAVGACPVIVDVVPDGWVIDPAEVESAITPATSAVVVSHLHGQIADCVRLKKICLDHKIVLIEDACQMSGGSISSRPLGSLGDAAVYSFGGSKLLTAGRGGALVTSNPDFHQRAKIYCNRGNEAFPLSQLQAAVLAPQFEKLATNREVRRQNAQSLMQTTDGIPILKGLQPPDSESELIADYHELPWFIDDVRSNWTRADFIKAVQAEGVAVDVGYRGFTRRGVRRCRQHGALIHSRVAAQQTMVLHHPVLLDSESVIAKVAEAFAKVANWES